MMDGFIIWVNNPEHNLSWLWLYCCGTISSVHYSRDMSAAQVVLEYEKDSESFVWWSLGEEERIEWLRRCRVSTQLPPGSLFFFFFPRFVQHLASCRNQQVFVHIQFVNVHKDSPDLMLSECCWGLLRILASEDISRVQNVMVGTLFRRPVEIQLLVDGKSAWKSEIGKFPFKILSFLYHLSG